MQRILYFVHSLLPSNLFLQKATHDLDIINSIVDLKPVSVAAFGSRLVYGGDMSNDLTCDTCEKKMTCTMSVHRRLLDTARPLTAKHERKCVYAKEIDIDDNQVMIIQYEGGVTASYSQSFNAPLHGGRRGGTFIGTEGVMNLEYYGDYVENSKHEITLGNSQIDITRINAKPGTKIHEVYDWAGHNHFDGKHNRIAGCAFARRAFICRRLGRPLRKAMQNQQRAVKNPPQHICPLAAVPETA